MAVEVNIPPSLQALTDGVGRVEVDGGTIGACLRALVRLYPRIQEKVFTRNGRLLKGLHIFINGKSAGSRPLAMPVRNGDKVHVAYLVLGG